MTIKRHRTRMFDSAKLCETSGLRGWAAIGFAFTLIELLVVAMEGGQLQIGLGSPAPERERASLQGRGLRRTHVVPPRRRRGSGILRRSRPAPAQGKGLDHRGLQREPQAAREVGRKRRDLEAQPLESLTGETCGKQVKFLCCVEGAKDSPERGLRRAQPIRAGERGGKTRGLFMEMRTGFGLRRVAGTCTDFSQA